MKGRSGDLKGYDHGIGQRPNPVPIFGGLDRSEVRPLGRIVGRVIVAIVVLFVFAFVCGRF